MKRGPKNNDNQKKDSRKPSTVQNESRNNTKSVIGNGISMVSAFTGVRLDDSVTSTNADDVPKESDFQNSHYHENGNNSIASVKAVPQATPSPHNSCGKILSNHKAAVWTVTELPSSVGTTKLNLMSPKKSKTVAQPETPTDSTGNLSNITSTPNFLKENGLKKEATPSVTPKSERLSKGKSKTPDKMIPSKETPISKKVISIKTALSAEKRSQVFPESTEVVHEAFQLGRPVSARAVYAAMKPQTPTPEKTPKRRKSQGSIKDQERNRKRLSETSGSPALRQVSSSMPQTKTPSSAKALSSGTPSTPSTPQESSISHPKRKRKSLRNGAAVSSTPTTCTTPPSQTLIDGFRPSKETVPETGSSFTSTPHSIQKALDTTPVSANVHQAQRALSARAAYALLKSQTPPSSSKSVKRKKEATPGDREEKKSNNVSQGVPELEASIQQISSSKKKRRRKSGDNASQEDSALPEIPTAHLGLVSGDSVYKRDESVLSQPEHINEPTSNEPGVCGDIEISNLKPKARQPIIFQPTTNFIDSPQPRFNPARVLERQLESGRLKVPEIEEEGRKLVSVLDYLTLTEHSALLFLPPNSYLPFKGRFSLTVIAGSVTVLGCKIEANLEKSFPLYSSRGYSLIPLQTQESGGSSHVDAFFEQRPEFKQHQAYCRDKVNKEDQILLMLERFDNPLTEYLKVYHETNLLQWDSVQAPEMSPESIERYKSICKTLDTSFLVPGITWKASSSRVIQIPSEWEKLVACGNVADDAVITLCGGKGVGKSTLLRYLVNRLLGQYPSVLVLDLDPGQAEFVPPGCVSAVVVTEPLLGPNFTHLRTPELSYFVGDVNMANCPDRYSDAVKRLVGDCRAKGYKVPCVVNTMGFSSGLGFDLTLDVLRLVQPSLVIELRSRTSSRNFPIELSADNVWRCSDGWLTRHHAHDSQLNYNYTSLLSKAESHTRAESNEWGMSPTELRNIMILAYWSRLAPCPLPDNWSLCHVTPYSVPLHSLYLSVCHEIMAPGLVLAAMLGNQVALCNLEEACLARIPCFVSEKDDTPPRVLTQWPSHSPCLGYGLVRAVDIEKGTVYILTPEPIERLGQVNALAMGNVFLPQVVYAKAPKGARIPFMEVGLPATGPSLYQPGRKKNLPRQQGGLSA